MFGALEAGGTKFVCGIGTGPADLKTQQFPTTTPAATLAGVVDFFKNSAGERLQALGIGSFGPVDLHPSSPTFGHITSTPKPGWQDFDLAGTLGRALKVPVRFETDVNASVLAETRWGAAQGLRNVVYLTIGTGVGGGVLVHGSLIHGLVHPEIGHLHIPHDFSRDPFPGICPYHGDCLEGLTCGPAMQARWGEPASSLPPDHPAWELEAHYLALGLVNLTVTLSPQRIILGGGVMQQSNIFGQLRREFARILNRYVRHPAVTSQLDEFIQPPGLGNQSGVLGGIVLAEEAHSCATLEQYAGSPKAQA